MLYLIHLKTVKMVLKLRSQWNHFLQFTKEMITVMQLKMIHLFRRYHQCQKNRLEKKLQKNQFLMKNSKMTRMIQTSRIRLIRLMNHLLLQCQNHQNLQRNHQCQIQLQIQRIKIKETLKVLCHTFHFINVGMKLT